MKPIATELGELHWRDAIYIDTVTRDGDRLEFTGEISGRLCAPPEDAWIAFRLRFLGVRGHETEGIETCVWARGSSFEQSDEPGERVFVLVGYDHAHRVTADAFQFDVLSRRPRQTRAVF